VSDTSTQTKKNPQGKVVVKQVIMSLKAASPHIPSHVMDWGAGRQLADSSAPRDEFHRERGGNGRHEPVAPEDR